jgi:lipopolysaccharide export LptBFGC system permease protein LptF
MHKIGVMMVWLGLILVVVGLIFGFMDLVKYGEASIWIAMIPAGFAALLTGVTMTQFSKSKDSDTM